MARRVRSESWSAPPQDAMGFAEAPQASIIDDAATVIERDRVRTILDIAREEGMLEAKTARISGRVSPVLIERAKLRTGLGSDTDLIEFALASLAVDDDFAAVFRRLEGTVDPDVPLGY